MLVFTFWVHPYVSKAVAAEVPSSFTRQRKIFLPLLDLDQINLRYTGRKKMPI